MVSQKEWDKLSEEEKKKHFDIILKLVVFLFVARGVVNILFPVIFNSPWDEYWLGPNSTLLLNLFMILAGVGTFLRKDWAYYPGMVISVVAFAMQSDSDFASRSGGEIMSMLMFFGLWQLRKYKIFETTKNGKKIGFGLVVILLLVAVYEYVQTTQWYRTMVTQEAIEKGDWRVCERLDRGYRSDCIIGVAKQKQDVSLCTKLSGTSKDDCYYSLAVVLHNSTICEKIDNVYERSRCPGSVS